MKVIFLVVLSVSSFLVRPLCALPNAILGPLTQNENPLDGKDLTEAFLAPRVWEGKEELPGEWEAEDAVAKTQVAFLKAQPRVFGVDALLVRSLHRGETLEELQVTFADAGSFFAYLDQRLPSELSHEEAVAKLVERIEEKKREFSEFYQEKSQVIREKLEKLDPKPRETKKGRTRDLRAFFKEYHDKKSGLVISLLEATDRLIRISIRKKGAADRTWLDSDQEKLATRERLQLLEKNVSQSKEGDVILSGVPIVPQGYRPYCGLNTLVMVARYLGLHLDEDWLAVAGKFQNTGSSAGSDMLGLYSAVAKEARFQMERKSRYDHGIVRRSLRAGMPVIVWRRWNQERDRLHSEISQQVSRGSERKFERPSEKTLPSKEKRSPLHASVIIGYNDERKEVLFLESWLENAAPRRMPVSEIAHTSDLIFAFRP